MKLIKKEGVFRLYDRQATLILTDEKQLARIAESPDKLLFDDEERGYSGEKKGIYPPGTTLDSFMQSAKNRGCTRIEVSYDFFFGGTKRENYPDSPLTVAAYEVISRYAAKYGMAFGASLVSPLDLGGGYVKSHTDRGYTWQMNEGAICGGKYSLTFRRQRQWYNNKGPISLSVNRVMALAFDEEKCKNGRDWYVDIDSVEDISDTAVWTPDESKFRVTGSGYGYDEMTVSGRTDTCRKRVLILTEYATPEQDYFAPDAIDYYKQVLDLHASRGISYRGFYSDEMHIQFDWDLDEHFGPTEIRTRYVTDSLINEYASRYGEKYRDFAKYMIYFAYTPHDGVWANHVCGKDTEGMYETVLFRKRYFELLSRRIVDLSCEAKTYAESLFGAPIMTRAHATWQESPTCDHFSDDYSFSHHNRMEINRYDYDKPYVWSSTIRENTSACGDYFRWNEYLTGNGTDHPEGGNTDRNYYAQAFAAGLGNLNRYGRAYCASWGSPAPVQRRFNAVGAAFGSGSMEHAFCQDFRHRLSDVLLLYPTELNYAEERFGSWMIQYGYCDYITEEKLLKFAVPTRDGLLHVNGRKYRAVVALFEPFVDQRTLDLFENFAEHGGRVIWTGPAALRFEDGTDAKARFQQLFGLGSVASLDQAEFAEDREVCFSGRLDGIGNMRILTSLLPDAVYPILPAEAQTVAVIGGKPVGACKKTGAGVCVYLGFRPRDDQSCSSGKDISTLFDILMKLGAYTDGTESVSRPAGARYLIQRFENGCVSIANHYRTFAEAWYGSFFRDEAKDKELLKGRTLPPIEIELRDELIANHRLSYSGTDALSFRLNAEGGLAAFAGSAADGITVDGQRYTLFSRKADLCFALVAAEKTYGRVMCAKASEEGTFTLPANGFRQPKAGVCKLDFYETDYEIPILCENGTLTVNVGPEEKNKYILIYE